MALPAAGATHYVCAGKDWVQLGSVQLQEGADVVVKQVLGPLQQADHLKQPAALGWILLLGPSRRIGDGETRYAPQVGQALGPMQAQHLIQRCLLRGDAVHPPRGVQT